MVEGEVRQDETAFYAYDLTAIVVQVQSLGPALGASSGLLDLDDTDPSSAQAIPIMGPPTTEGGALPKGRKTLLSDFSPEISIYEHFGPM